MIYEEENNYPKAFLSTGIILGVVMLLCYFIVFQAPPVQDSGTGGILVNYGTTDEGMGKDITSTEEPATAPKANNTKPDKVTQAPPTEQKTKVDNSDKNVVTQNTEDAAEVAANSKKPSQSVATAPSKPVAKPVVNQSALYKGSANKGTGSGDGTTGKPGNQGSKLGSPTASNYGEGGSGGGLSLPNWSFINPPDVQNPKRVPGTVVVDFVIDQNGNVLQVSSNRSRTKADLDLVQACLDAIRSAKFKSSSTATGNQKGQMTFIFKVD